MARARLPTTSRRRRGPLNVYGRTKRDGESAIAAIGGANLIFRTSWVYGLRGGNFLLTMLRLAAEREELRVVADQFGVPNWSRDLAETIADARRPGPAGARRTQPGCIISVPAAPRTGSILRARSSATSNVRESFRSRPRNIRRRLDDPLTACWRPPSSSGRSASRCRRGAMRWRAASRHAHAMQSVA